MAPPLLVVVSGPPGSGTTTLARALADAIPCAALSRDEIKEGVVHGDDAYTPASGDDANRHTFETLFGVMSLLVDAGVAFVVEASFQHGLWEHGLRPLLDRADVRIVHCRVDPAVAWERIGRRAELSPARRAVHGYYSLLEPYESFAAKLERFESVELGVPSLEVDTSDGYDPPLEAIVAFLNRS